MNILAEAVGALRLGGNQRIRDALVGDDALDESELASSEDLGLFGPSSVIWRVHSDSAMLIGGLRALLLQTLHPLAMAGVAQHSDYRNDPWGRLNRTSRFVGATTFGSTETAEAAIATVRRVHEHVKGTASDGRAYEANDPHLLLWVHLTEVDSFLRAFDSYGAGKLRDDERDSYVANMAEIARRLGAEKPPTTVAELEASLEGFRAECKITPEGREAVRFLLLPPVSFWMRGSYGLIASAALTLLPGWASRELRLPMPPLLAPLVVQPAAAALTRTVGWFMAGGSSQAKIEDQLLATP